MRNRNGTNDNTLSSLLPLTPIFQGWSNIPDVGEQNTDIGILLKDGEDLGRGLVEVCETFCLS
jgi:hypothetical protein